MSTTGPTGGGVPSFRFLPSTHDALDLLDAPRCAGRQILVAVLCDEDRCVGCWMCVMVCPYGVIHSCESYDRSQGKIASKCDLCAGEDVPACVAHCPNEALTLSEE